MLSKTYFLIIILSLIASSNQAQLMADKKAFTKADSLRGMLNENRDWWDVQHYELSIKPNITNKTIEGNVIISFKGIKLPTTAATLQIDLQQPLIADSILWQNKKIPFTRNGNIVLVSLITDEVFAEREKTKLGLVTATQKIQIFYHGTPKAAIRAPWDGGLVWAKDKLGNPWIATACQGLGASVWWPCKDHQSDEPNNGVLLHYTVPDTLTAVGNGKLIATNNYKPDNLTTYTWQIKNPINSYCVTMNVGKYGNFTDTYDGVENKLNLNYWVLAYNLSKAKEHFTIVPKMLQCFEYWFGKYPFPEDDYKLIETPFVGMEHQSGVAYGNRYLNGYTGNDLSATGYGMAWDYMIVHESGHEWFGNNITTKDIADMWVHESFTCYSETLFTEFLFNKAAGDKYNYGLRRNIENDSPIIGTYNVNKEGSGDMYSKGANMLHTIRHSMNNDEKFRGLLQALNKTFYHQTVTGKQVEYYISQYSNEDYSKVFQQYLYTTQIPSLLLEIDNTNKIFKYKWSNCVDGFNLKIASVINSKQLLFSPTTSWQSKPLDIGDIDFLTKEQLEKSYYIKTAITYTTN